MGKKLKGKECGKDICQRTDGKVSHRKRTPMHCKIVLNRMDASYTGSTIRQTYIVIGTMFRSAVNNNIIIDPHGWCARSATKSEANGSVCTPSGTSMPPAQSKAVRLRH